MLLVCLYWLHVYTLTGEWIKKTTTRHSKKKNVYIFFFLCHTEYNFTTFFHDTPHSNSCISVGSLFCARTTFTLQHVDRLSLVNKTTLLGLEKTLWFNPRNTNSGLLGLFSYCRTLNFNVFHVSRHVMCSYQVVTISQNSVILA